LAYILNRAETSYDWKKFFGSEHRHAERMMIFLKQNRESNIDAFLVQLDSYCDFLTSELYGRLKPGKIYPKFGHAIKDPLLNAQLPCLMACFKQIHELRLDSTTAHPKSLKTGKATRRLRHRDFYKIRREIIDAFNELEGRIVP